jgi:hypothetical protein
MDFAHYSRALLALYARLPGTPARPRPTDRRLLEQLHAQGVASDLVEAALFLAVARRICRDPSKPPLPQVRSLAYFLPVIQELQQQPLPSGYLDYLRSKVHLND